MNLHYFTLEFKDIFLVVISAIIGWLTSRYYRTIQRKELSYSHDYDPLLPRASRNEGFSFLYQEQNLHNPIKVSVSLWNSGTIYLDRSDFASDTPIKLKFIGYKVFASQIARSPRPENEFSILQNASNDTVFVDLRFLDPNDAVKLEIFIDRQDDHPFNFYDDVKVAAVVKGATSALQHSFSFATRPTNRTTFLYLLFLLALLLQTALLVGDLYHTGIFTFFALPKLIALGAFVLIGLLMIVIPLSDMPKKGREYPESLK